MQTQQPTLASKPPAIERRASQRCRGRNLVVRIPRELELEGTEGLMRNEGDRLKFERRS